MKLIKKEILPDFFERWDLEIEGTHNFIAEGVVVHNTSAHITFRHKPNAEPAVEVIYFSGGTKHETFKGLFNESDLINRFAAMTLPIDKELTVYGESYGGREQGMSHTYGTTAKFIAFDVRINDSWLNVPKAEKVVIDLGLEFVHYVKVPTELTTLDAWRDAPSVQAIRNGISQLLPTDTLVDSNQTVVISDTLGGVVVNPRKREGVVLRPLVELTKNNDNRLIVKHKGDDFKETKTAREVVDPAKQKVLSDAQEVADEWVTFTRLQHVLDKLPGHCMEKMRDIIAAMTEDVLREGVGEIVDSPAVKKAISTKTAILYKDYLKSLIGK